MSSTAKKLETVMSTATTSNTALTVVKGTNGTDSKNLVGSVHVVKPAHGAINNTTKLKEEPKKVETKTEEKKEVLKPLTFEERKERSKELAILFEKHDKLKKHSTELLAIVKADESVNTRFYLESSNGADWQTTNQEFIKKTIKVMQEAIQEKILETEIEIELIQIG